MLVIFGVVSLSPDDFYWVWLTDVIQHGTHAELGWQTPQKGVLRDYGFYRMNVPFFGVCFRNITSMKEMMGKLQL